MQFPEEYELRLELNGRTAIRLLCTCDSLRELVTGFLYNEGLVTAPSDIRELTIGEGMACVRLRNEPEVPTGARPSGLGSPVLTAAVPVSRSVRSRYPLEFVLDCVRQMQALAVGYREFGGMHCSALFRPGGMLAAFEDIGRHNTLDKLGGHCLLHGICPEDALLLTSGRISSDMVRKAARMGVSVIASYSTATQNAVDLARAANVTLIIYAGKKAMEVCTGKERME